MKTVKILPFILLTFCSLPVRATTYYTVANGNWSGNIWSSVCTTCTPGGALPALSANDILVIDDQITITSTVTIAPKITINIVSNSAAGAQLNFQNGKKLDLTNASSVINLSNTNPSSFPNPQINAGGGGGNSNTVTIGGNKVWAASDPDISGTGQITSTSTNGSLPVTLISFSSAVVGRNVELHWSTASELNFDFFEVENSSDGIGFKSIGRINGNGTTSIRHDYSFEDKSPSIGRNYYRLKSVDFDGYTEYFNVVSADFYDEKEFNIYPNPTDGKSINAKINFQRDQGYSIAVFNSLGVPVGKFSSSQPEIELTFTDILPLGVYYAKFSSPYFNQTRRFLVAR